MKVLFTDKKLEVLYNTGISKDYPADIIQRFVDKVDYIMQCDNPVTLITIRSLHFEKLKNYSQWTYSIRVNRKRRIIFDIIQYEIQIIAINELSNHYL
jgi:plasmid maintenance system killer protein